MVVLSFTPVTILISTVFQLSSIVRLAIMQEDSPPHCSESIVWGTI